MHCPVAQDTSLSTCTCAFVSSHVVLWCVMFFSSTCQVRHPNVKQRIFMDFQIMKKIAQYTDATPSLKWMNLGPSMEQFSHTMAAQVPSFCFGLLYRARSLFLPIYVGMMSFVVCIELVLHYNPDKHSLRRLNMRLSLGQHTYLARQICFFCCVRHLNGAHRR